MGVPNVGITKTDGNTGVVAPSSQGVLAIIAPSEKGTANSPASVTRANLALSTFGYGILTDAAAYVMATAKKPVVLIRGTASTAADYGSVTQAGTGSSVATEGSSSPLDDFDVLVTVVVGGTRGTAGITYTYSLDGGKTTSAVQALGTATTLSIPNSGVSFDLGTGTLVAGDTISVKTTGPRMTTSDVSTALEALRTSALPWEMVLVLGHDATSTTVSTIDAWLSAREAEGKFRGFIAGARLMNAGETEAQYLTAMTTAFASAASIRGCVSADGGDLASVLPGRGIVQKRKTALALAARAMLVPYGRDVAYVKDGPVIGFGLADAQGNPKNHDESLYPGLDAIRLVTLRTFDRRQGTFITNAPTIATSGSDYVYLQHIRCMNRACELAYDVLTGELSKGVNTNPKPGPNGEVYIDEGDAQQIEALVNQALNELRGQVSDLKFTLSRTDDLGSNGPATIGGEVRTSSLRYVKQFNVNASFARTITQ